MRKSHENPIYVYPAKGVEGDLILLRFPTMLPLTEDLEVRVGGRVALDLVVQDEHTLLCRLPEDDAGRKDIVVLDGEGRELVRQDAVLEHAGGSRLGAAKAKADPALRGSVSAVQMPSISQTNPASDWWMLHQDPAHTANARGYSYTPLKKLWKQTFPNPLTTSQPIIGDGLVLVGLLTGVGERTFAALDEETGQVRWVRERPGWEWTGHPVAANGRVYFVERYQAGVASDLVCLRIDDGSFVWSVPFQSGWVVLDNGAGLAAANAIIYCNFSNGMLNAYWADSGTLAWEADIGSSEVAYRPSPPAIGFGSVYVGSIRGLRAFNDVNGSLRWAVGTSDLRSRSPVVVYESNPPVVVIGERSDYVLRAYNATYGWLMWEINNVVPWAPATADGKLYLGDLSFRRIVEIDATSGTRTAISPDLGGRLTASPTVAGDRLLAVVWTPPHLGRIVVLRLRGLAIESTVDIPDKPIDWAAGRAIAEGGRVYISARPSVEEGYGGIAIQAFERGDSLSFKKWLCRRLPAWLRRLLCP